MMSVLENLIHDLIVQSGRRDGIPLSRIMKLVYLVDWYAAIHFNHQITDVEWVHGLCGPYSSRVHDCIMNSGNRHFSVQRSRDRLGNEKVVVSILILNN